MEKYFERQNFSCLLDITKWIVHIQKYCRLINLHDHKDVIGQYSALIKT